MRTVRDIIATKPTPINIIEPAALVIDALYMLESVNLSYLIVMEGDRYRGIFSERDYSRNVALKGLSSRTARVEEAMTTDLPDVEFYDTVETCMHMMAKYRVRYLQATHNGHFEGIITIH